MARIKIRLKLTLRLYFQGQLVHSYSYHKKRSLLASLLRFDWDKAYLRVTYPLGAAYFNDGYYETPERLKKALSLFTEWQLIRDIS